MSTFNEEWLREYNYENDYEDDEEDSDDALESTFKSGNECDIILISNDGEKMNAHKNVLSGASGYFRTKLRSTFKHFSEIPLRFASSEILRQILVFIYLGEVQIKKENVGQFIKVSKSLRIDDLLDLCWNWYMDNINSSNFVEAWNLSKECDRTDIEERVVSFVGFRFKQLAKEKVLLNLEPETFKNILKLNDLYVDSEEDVYKALVDWIDHDNYMRNKHFIDLLTTIRFRLLSPEFIRKQVEPRCNYKLRKWIKGFFEWSVPQPGKGELDSLDALFATRRSLFDCSVLVSVEKEDKLIFFRYSLKENEWREKYETHKNANHFGKLVTCYGNTLVFINKKNQISSYIFNTKQWNYLTSIPLSRSNYSIAVVDDFQLWTIGGNDEICSLRAVECIDLHTGELTECPPMQSERKGSAVVVIGQNLFVIGGHDDRDTLKTVEMYNFKSKKWELKASMPEKRYKASAVVHGKDIYVVGGLDSHMRFVDSIIKYDPLRNYWTTMKRIEDKDIIDAQVVSIHSELFILKVFFNSHYLVRYDPSANQLYAIVSPFTYDFDMDNPIIVAIS